MAKGDMTQVSIDFSELDTGRPDEKIGNGPFKAFFTYSMDNYQTGGMDAIDFTTAAVMTGTGGAFDAILRVEPYLNSNDLEGHEVYWDDAVNQLQIYVAATGVELADDNAATNGVHVKFEVTGTKGN